MGGEGGGGGRGWDGGKERKEVRSGRREARLWR